MTEFGNGAFLIADLIILNAFAESVRNAPSTDFFVHCLKTYYFNLFTSNWYVL